MQVALSISAAPRLGQDAVVTFVVRPGVDAPNTTMAFELPAALRVVDGLRSWQGDLKRDHIQAISVTVRAVEAGAWAMTGTATSANPDGSAFGRSTNLYLFVGEDQSRVSTVPQAAADSQETGEPASTAEPRSPKLMSPMAVTAGFVTPPVLNATTTLSVVVGTSMEAPNTVVRVQLPASMEPLATLSDWRGDISAGGVVAFEIPVRIVGAGQSVLSVEAISQADDGSAFGDTASLYVNVAETDAVVSAVPFAAGDAETLESKSEPSTVVAPQVATGGSIAVLTPESKVNDAANSVAPQAALGSVTIFGYWYYRDRDGVDHPLRDARIEIWDQDSTSEDDLLAVTYTNNSGRYQSTVDNSDCLFCGGVDVYVRVFSTDDFSVRVTNLNDPPGRYFSSTPVIDDVPDGNRDMGSWVITDANNRMAWYMYDKIANDAFDYLYYAGWVNNFNLQVRWTPTSATGTYYSGGVVSMLAGDRWDEDVLLHEFGHFVMDKIYAAYPPTPNCNPHAWGSPSSDGCALSEGWATFLQGAIQGHDDYIDTEDQTLHIRMEPPSPAARQTNDEGAVAASWWDIFDSGVEAHDTLANGINGSAANGIWKTMANYDPKTIGEFWNSWVAAGNGFNCKVAGILQHHQINYGTACPAAPRGLVVVPLSRTNIQLFWLDAATDETEFRIERSPTGSGDWEEIAAVPANASLFVNRDVACGQTYFYRVRAFRGGDAQWSDYSDIVGVTSTCAYRIYTPVLSQ